MVGEIYIPASYRYRMVNLFIIGRKVLTNSEDNWFAVSFKLIKVEW